MHSEFSLKDMGDLNYFLRIEVDRSKKRIKLSQRKYINDLLVKTKMHGEKSYSKPMITERQLLILYGDILQQLEQYRNVIVALQYLTITRPYITFDVSKLCQYVYALRTAH